jgi:hypothetical protein
LHPAKPQKKTQENEQGFHHSSKYQFSDLDQRQSIRSPFLFGLRRPMESRTHGSIGFFVFSDSNPYMSVL